LDEQHVIGAADVRITGVCNQGMGLVLLYDLKAVVRRYPHDINESSVNDIANLGAVFGALALS